MSTKTEKIGEYKLKKSDNTITWGENWVSVNSVFHKINETPKNVFRAFELWLNGAEITGNILTKISDELIQEQNLAIALLKISEEYEERLRNE